MSNFDVIAVGDANIDLVVEGCKAFPLPGQEVRIGNITTNLGGGAAISAIGLSRLGLRTAFCGVLCSDLYGSFVLEQFKNNHVETFPIKANEDRGTGVSIALFGEEDRAFITYDGSNSDLDISKIDMEIIKQARHVHVTGYRGSRNHYKYMKFIRSLKDAGITISTDAGWDDTGEWYEGIFDLISCVDVFFTNEVETINYTRCKNAEEGLDELAKYCGIVVVKLGPKGAYARMGSETIHEGAHKVEVVDTTGAGDSFNAGFLYGFLRNGDLRKCLSYGNACGGLSVTKPGGSAGFPDIETLEAFINKTVGR